MAIYKDRSTNVKTATQGIDHTLGLMVGKWQEEFVEVAQALTGSDVLHQSGITVAIAVEKKTPHILLDAR